MKNFKILEVINKGEIINIHLTETTIQLCDGFSGPEQNLKDAHLISAAPEMLEALELVLNDNRLMNAMNKSQVHAIMDAVSKARGEK